ncbi:MAG: L-seryl-tRNA(Sec) selenium transferase, partial [Vicinamibacterales bacterium]
LCGPAEPKHGPVPARKSKQRRQMRDIPSIEQLRQRPAMRAMEAEFGRAALVDALRAEAEALRRRVAAGEAPPADVGSVLEREVPARLAAQAAPSLRPVINATGVILHTNLGRAPLAPAALHRVTALGGYTNLEYDLASGQRGRRDTHAERLLCRLTGAAAAVVVNNNAAATLIALAALAAGREVIISRGELVEIGGGFRVPDVMAQSGAILREVGTTNRTRAADYAAAISDRAAAILRVHPSNFRIEGFTERPVLQELAALARRFNLLLIEDIGSGWLGAAAPPAALRDEPAPGSSIAAGADVVLFSGDKLMGGPQAGVIAGSASAVESVRRHPLMRALRVDKMTYAALEATLEEYSAGRAGTTVPVARMIALSSGEIAVRAEALVRRMPGADLSTAVIGGESTIGGGSAPGSSLPTRLLALTHRSLSPVQIEARLRASDPPVIARIDNERVVLDLRTVMPEEDEVLLELLRRIDGDARERQDPS